MRKIVLIFIFVIIIGFFLRFKQSDITGKATLPLGNEGQVANDGNETRPRVYTYTKAICNDSNHCQDYEIVCEGNITKSTNAITGRTVKFPKYWKDPRNKEEIERLC